MMPSSTNTSRMSRVGSIQSSDGRETKKYLLLRDTVAKSRSGHSGSRSRLLSKRNEQRVLKGSLWQEVDDGGTFYPPPPTTTKSLNRSLSSPSKTSGSHYKLLVESIEIEDLTIQCASAFLVEIPADICSLLLAIPTSEERYIVHSDPDRIYHARFINVGSDVIVFKRNIEPCRATVKWKGRLAGKQGIWFGVEIKVCMYVFDYYSTVKIIIIVMKKMLLCMHVFISVFYFRRIFYPRLSRSIFLYLIITRRCCFRLQPFSCNRLLTVFVISSAIFFTFALSHKSEY